MNWALSVLIAGVALASLVLNYPYWRRAKEPEYRLKRGLRTAFLLVATWALWTVAVHSAHLWPVLVVAVMACHMTIFIVYATGVSVE